MAPLRTLAAIVVGATAVSAFAPSSPLATRTVVPVVRYEMIINVLENFVEMTQSLGCFSESQFE